MVMFDREPQMGAEALRAIDQPDHHHCRAGGLPARASRLHPADGECGITVGASRRNSGREAAPAAARRAIPASGAAPSRLGPPAVPAAAAVRLEPGKAVVGPIAAVGAAQVGGTDRAPTAAARPKPADAAALPAPPVPAQPAGASAPWPSPPARPDASPPVTPVPEAAVPAPLRAGIKDLSWLRFDSSALDIHPTELVIDSAGLNELSDEFTDESADVDDSGEASPCNAVGTADMACDSVAWVFVATDVAVAWAAAAVCPASPPVLVVGCGAVNGANCEATAEEPA